MSEGMSEDMSEDVPERMSDQKRMSEDMPERMSKYMSEKNVRKNAKRYVRRYVRKECQKKCQKTCQKRTSEVMSVVTAWPQPRQRTRSWWHLITKNVKRFSWLFCVFDDFFDYRDCRDYFFEGESCYNTYSKHVYKWTTMDRCWQDCRRYLHYLTIPPTPAKGGTSLCPDVNHGTVWMG